MPRRGGNWGSSDIMVQSTLKKQKMEFIETDQYMAMHNGYERVSKDPIPLNSNLDLSQA